MRFHYLLMANFSMMQKLLMRRLKDTGLTPGQPKVLAELYERNGMTQSELAARCVLEAASVTSVIDGMERSGLVERKKDSANRRISRIWLTEKGQELADRVDQEFSILEQTVLNGLNHHAHTTQAMLQELYNILSACYSDKET